MATKQVDIILSLKNQGQGAKAVVNDLKRIEEQANKTREKMEKLTQVGTKLALAGGLIVAPFVLSLKKYVDTAKETEPVSRRLVELNKKWEESQVRLGRVTATIVLPALEKGAAILENVIAFAEKNPGVVQAALTIGGTLVILGGLITTTAQLVSTVATIQGLAASAGIALGGGGAAAGAAGGALAGGGLAAAVAAGVSLIIPALVTALALAIGAPIGLGIGNALAGTNQTWGDILTTVKQLIAIVKFAWLQEIPRIIAGALQALGGMIGNGLKYIADKIAGLFRGGQASGGYANLPGLYARAEKGREFVLNADTTRYAERAIGGKLTQSSAAMYMTNNFTLGGKTISQTRKQARNNQQVILGSLAGVFA